MNFNVQAKTTDIMMFNSRNLGALIVDKKPHVREWDEPQFDIKNIGIEESYLRSACSTTMKVWSSTATLEALKRDVDAGRRSIISVSANNMAFEEPLDVASADSTGVIRAARTLI
jgi:hypothetical protein